MKTTPMAKCPECGYIAPSATMIYLNFAPQLDFSKLTQSWLNLDTPTYYTNCVEWVDVIGSIPRWIALPDEPDIYDAVREYRDSHPETAPAEQTEPIRDADEFAVKFIEQRAAEYLQNHADTEPDTGAVAFKYGEAGCDYYNTLIELADDLRAALARTKGAS